MLTVLAMLAACAATPSKDEQQAAQLTARGNRDTASELYAGQPAVVHATEFPVASYEEGIQRGDAAWRQGKLDLAVYLYVQALAFDATQPAPFLKIGTIHEQLGNRALAEKAYELGLERDPGNAVARERLGLLYLQAGRDDDARSQFEQAVAVDPRRWKSFNGLGIIADRRHDYAAAIANYDRALALEPRAAAVMNNRGFSHYLSGDYAAAEIDLRAAIRLGSRDGAWGNLGKVQAAQGRYGDALESFMQQTDAASAHNLLGEAAMERGDYVQARRQFQAAVSTSPRYFDAAQKNLALVEERLASSDTSLSKFAVADALVLLGDTVVGQVKRGDRLPVLTVKGETTLVKFQESGADVTGWVPSNVLSDKL
jgi:tetratricopeptide (TPR) repeat protein